MGEVERLAACKAVGRRQGDYQCTLPQSHTGEHRYQVDYNRLLALQNEWLSVRLVEPPTDKEMHMRLGFARSCALSGEKWTQEDEDHAVECAKAANLIKADTEKPGDDEPETTDQPGRCGAFVSGTGEQCVLENDHYEDHRFASDTAPPETGPVAPIDAIAAIEKYHDGEEQRAAHFRRVSNNQGAQFAEERALAAAIILDILHALKPITPAVATDEMVERAALALRETHALNEGRCTATSAAAYMLRAALRGVG